MKQGRNYQNKTGFKLKKNDIIFHRSDEIKGTCLNRTCRSLYGESIKIIFLKSYWKEQKCFEFVLCNRLNLLFLLLCVKSELEEQWGHKVLTVMSIEFDLLLLVSLQWSQLKLIKSLCTDLTIKFYINSYCRRL